jgi:hypothetical protein
MGEGGVVVGRVQVPTELSSRAFRGSDAVAGGLVTKETLRRRAWRRLFTDVYVSADATDDHRMWCEAVALTLTGAEAIDRYSAAYLLGVDLLTPGAAVSVSSARKVHAWPHPRRVVVRAQLTPLDIVTVAGVPLTTPQRTAFDLGRQAHRVKALIALDALCHRHLVSLPDIAGYAGERSRWPGIRRLRELLPLVDARAESPMETELRLLLHDAGAPPPTPQYEVHDTDGRFIARVDLAYPRSRIAIEYEGDHHRERAQFRRDITRVNALQKAGWLVLRYTADDVRHHPKRLINQLATAIRGR